MVIIKKEHPDSSDEDMDEGGLASFDRHIKQEQLESFYSDSLASFSDPVIKQEHISLSDDDSLTYTVHLSDEAMSWDGYNMQQLDVRVHFNVLQPSSLTTSRASSTPCVPYSNVSSAT